jgi:hypothetical protein
MFLIFIVEKSLPIYTIRNSCGIKEYFKEGALSKFSSIKFSTSVEELEFFISLL